MYQSGGKMIISTLKNRENANICKKDIKINISDIVFYQFFHIIYKYENYADYSCRFC